MPYFHGVVASESAAGFVNKQEIYILFIEIKVNYIIFPIGGRCP